MCVLCDCVYCVMCDMVWEVMVVMVVMEVECVFRVKYGDDL